MDCKVSLGVFECYNTRIEDRVAVNGDGKVLDCELEVVGTIGGHVDVTCCERVLKGSHAIDTNNTERAGECAL